MSDFDKYLKYKNKYLNLKKMTGGKEINHSNIGNTLILNQNRFKENIPIMEEKQLMNKQLNSIKKKDNFKILLVEKEIINENLYQHDMNDHIHSLLGFYNKKDNLYLILKDIKINNSKENKIKIINNEKIQYNFTKQEELNIIEKSKDIVSNYNGNYNYSRNELNKSSLEFIFNLEKSKHDNKEMKGGNYLECLNINLENIESSKWIMIYSTPEERAYNREIFKLIMDKIISKNMAKTDVDINTKDFFCNTFMEFLKIIEKIKPDTIETIDKIYSIYNSDPDNPKIYKIINNIYINLDLSHRDQEDICKDLFINIKLNKSLINDIFDNNNSASSQNGITIFMEELNKILYTNANEVMITVERVQLIPSFEDISNGSYRYKLELAHLLIPGNRIVHNGIYDFFDVKKLLELFQININTAHTENINYANEINFIHWYCHRTDMYISSMHGYENYGDRTSFTDILDTNPYTKYCFEILANKNRYNFLNNSNGVFILSNTQEEAQNQAQNQAQDQAQDQALISNYCYKVNLIKVEMDRKLNQNTIWSKENKIRKYNVPFRTMEKDTSLNNNNVLTTKLYPLNDFLTREILEINNNIEMYKVIRNYFNKPDIKLDINTPLSKRAFEQHESNIKLIDNSIQDNNIITYLKYLVEPDRYNINWNLT